MSFHRSEAVEPSDISSEGLTRRQFLKLSTLAGSGFTLGIVLPGCSGRVGSSSAGGAAGAGPLNMPFVHIAPDSTVTVLSKHL